MAGASLTLDSAAVEALLAGLGRLGPGAFDGLLDQLGAQVEFQTARRFETERDPEGNPWPPSLRALTEGGQTLTKTARLRQSITRRVAADAVLVGTNVVYAAIHQFGGEIKQEPRTVTLYRHYDAKTDTFDPKFRKRSRSNFATEHQVGARTITMPARPFLGAGAQDLKELGEIAADWLRGATGGLAT